MSKVVLITGITGQDGSYLAELLLKKNFVVHGIIRRSSLIKTDRIDNLYYNKKYPHQPYKNWNKYFDDYRFFNDAEIDFYLEVERVEDAAVAAQEGRRMVLVMDYQKRIESLKTLHAKAKDMGLDTTIVDLKITKAIDTLIALLFTELGSRDAAIFLKDVLNEEI